MEEWLLEVCGETRKIVAWNKLTHKAVVAEAYVNAPSSKSRYMLRRPAVLDMWCGDRNGMKPYMPDETRKEICWSAWQVMDDMQVPIVKENRQAVTLPGLLPDDITSDSLIDTLETFLSSTTWWKSSLHVSKYSSEARFNRENSTRKDDTSQLQTGGDDRVKPVPRESAVISVCVDAVSESPRSASSSLDSEYSSAGSACRNPDMGWSTSCAESCGGHGGQGAHAQTGAHSGGWARSGGKDGAALTDMTMTKKQNSKKEVLLKATKVLC
jgi:hypothetical protein